MNKQYRNRLTDAEKILKVARQQECGGLDDEGKGLRNTEQSQDVSAAQGLESVIV